ncbi:hypothetical protein B0O99DRAFT_609839 [Bisporella sp. PMI_857]|nr:hypothetical protein B0O99DRAFT_609839 [Bisporella sp. PMI_857]
MYVCEVIPTSLRRNKNVLAKVEIPDRPGDENASSSSSPTRPSAFTASNAEFLYGKGTMLETIKEKKSNNTIKTTGRTSSLIETNQSSFLNQEGVFGVLNGPRRKTSFSTGDLVLTGDAYHEAISMIEKMTHPVNEIYAEPKAPLHEPLHRPETPPGLPSWTEYQRLGPRGIPVSNNNGLRRLLSILPRNLTSSQRGRASSAPVSGILSPMSRFRAPRSAYSSVAQHPFNRATISKADASSVLLSSPPPPTDSERVNNRTVTSGTVEGSFSRVPVVTDKREPGQRVQFTTISSPAPSPGPITIRTDIDVTFTPGVPRYPLAHMAYIPPPSYALPSQRSCTHGAHSVLSMRQYEPHLMGSLPPVLPPLSHPWRSRSPSRESTAGLDFRLRELGLREEAMSSRTCLMSGALRPPSQSLGDKMCWRCRIETMKDSAVQQWAKWKGMLCYMCCGVEYDSEGAEMNVAEVVMMRPGSGLGRVVSIGSRSVASPGELL